MQKLYNFLLITFTAVILAYVFDQPQRTIAQNPLADLIFSSVTAYEKSSGTITVTWKLNRAPTAAEKPTIVLRNNAGVALAEPRQVGTAQQGEFQVRGSIGTQYKIELRNISSQIIHRSAVTAAVPPPEAVSGGEGKRFQDTLFGDNITAPQYIRRLYIWSVGIAILGASAMIIYAGFKYTASRGNPSELSSAKEIIVSSLVGLALLVLSFTILRFLGLNLQ